MQKSGDLRMLGSRDGFAHALIRVRQEIAHIAGPYSPRIDPRHVRKLAERERRLRPLRDLEKWIVEQHLAVRDAYLKSCQ